MAEVRGVLGIQSGDYYGDFMLDANCVAGAVGLRSTAVNSAGEVVDASTTGAANAIGIYQESVTYTAAPTVGSGNESMGAIGRLSIHPLQIVRFRASGGATDGTALATTAPANILTNTAQDTNKVTVTAAEVGTVSMAGGIMVGMTGANKGQARRISAHTNSTSTAVEVAYLNTIAVNDKFIRVPWSKAGIDVQFTTALLEANAIIATGTGAPMSVYGLEFDLETPAVFAYLLFRDSYYSTEAA